MFRFHRADWLTVLFAVRGFFDWQNVVVANAVLRAGDTILDIGSNVGTETLLYARMVGSQGKLLAFEPEPENFRVLKDLVELNGLSQVDLHQEAVADRAGKLRFMPPVEMNCGVGRLVHEGGRGEGLIEVDTVVLDELMAAGHFSSARLMVMDVEGAELHVLRGAVRFFEANRPVVVFENQPPLLKKLGTDPNDILQFFITRGYCLWAITSFGLKPVTPDTPPGGNWVAIPQGASAEGRSMTKRISRRLLRALVLPPIKYLNPAVVTTSSS